MTTRSVAPLFAANDVAYSIVTYSPAGAPGSVVAYPVPLRFRLDTAPRGVRAVVSSAIHLSRAMLFLKSAEAASQLSPYFPASVSVSHCSAATRASRTGPDSGVLTPFAAEAFIGA